MYQRRKSEQGTIHASRRQATCSVSAPQASKQSRIKGTVRTVNCPLRRLAAVFWTRIHSGGANTGTSDKTARRGSRHSTVVIFESLTAKEKTALDRHNTHARSMSEMQCRSETSPSLVPTRGLGEHSRTIRSCDALDRARPQMHGGSSTHGALSGSCSLILSTRWDTAGGCSLQSAPDFSGSLFADHWALSSQERRVACST